MSDLAIFDYSQATARNAGLLSATEQTRLRNACVALPGLGGVGGAHLLVLARMGIGAFKLADPDKFEVANFNRQMGACMSSVGRNKAVVMAEMARDINPEAKVEAFTDGITTSTIDAFLEGVDVVVDGIEFFRPETRWMLYRACRTRRIPVVAAGPVGYGAAVLVEEPGCMPMEEFFGLQEDMTKAEQLLAMAINLSPGLARDIDPAYLNPETQKGPALASTCALCAAAAGTEVLKLLCGRGRVSATPRGIYYDLYRGRTRTLRPRPALTRTLRGRVLRWLAFRRYPGFRRMHEREQAERAKGETLGTGLQPSL